jgi:quercetin dioxygenase-like cupin family protein
MRHVAFALFLVAAPLAAFSQSPKSVPLGQGRPETPGVTRTQIRDDAKSSVVRVSFAPGAYEPPHTHPYDVILIPVTDGPVEFGVGDKSATAFKIGEVQVIPKDTSHHLKNTGNRPIEFITVAVK